MSLEKKIPRIIHQLWIGPKPAPTKFMDSWKNKNPDFGELSEYELNVLKHVHDKHGHLGPWEISKLTHDLPEYEDPHGSSFPIDPNTILRAEGKSDPEIERINHSAEEAYQFDRFLRRCAVAAS